MKTIDVGVDFSPSLTNRDKYQRDGTDTGEQFRKKYLDDLDKETQWKSSDVFIIFDFSNVKRLGPSWANEAFAYFTKYGKPENILKKIQLINITNVKLATIKQEIETGYSKN